MIDGFSLITKPGLKRFVIIPLLINFLLFVILFFVLRHYLGEFNHWIASILPHWLAWLSILLWLIFLFAFFLVFIFTFVMVANIIAAPFNGLLAEKVTCFLCHPESAFCSKDLHQKIPHYARNDSISGIAHSLSRQFAIIFYYIPRAILCLLLFFIPLMQPIAAIIWFLFSAWFMALTYFDYPTDNHHVSFQEEKKWLQERRWMGYGFGASVLIATMIPFVNLFIIPAAVAGATKAWLKET